MDRSEVLSTALEYITKDRNATHGRAEDSFSVIADLWTTYLSGRGDTPLEPHDVAAMMVLFKMARVKASSTHVDNWIDSAGYSALGAELAARVKQADTARDNE